MFIGDRELVALRSPLCGPVLPDHVSIWVCFAKRSLHLDLPLVWPKVTWPLRRPPGEQEAGRSATAGLWSGTSARPHLPRRGLGGGEGMALKALVVASGTWVFDLRST